VNFYSFFEVVTKHFLEILLKPYANLVHFSDKPVSNKDKKQVGI
jgi:hypothetical protein